MISTSSNALAHFTNRHDGLRRFQCVPLNYFTRCISKFYALALFVLPWTVTAQGQSRLAETIRQVQPKMVKIFGGGGLRRLESWQSGFLISNEGLVVTTWSYIIGDETTVVLDDGERLQATLVGYHPQMEIAVLRLPIDDPPGFNLDNSGQAMAGGPVLAFSNLYGIATGNEKCSVQAGFISAVIPLNARRGNRPVTYQGPSMIVDAAINNPGAAGGAITDYSGRFLGLIGREARDASSNLWVNYAIPAKQVANAVDSILARSRSETNAGSVGTANKSDRIPSEPMTLQLLGIDLIPDVVQRTPPFVDHVVPGRAAAKAGLLADDLIVEINGQIMASHKKLKQQLTQIDRASEIRLLVQRGEQFVSLVLRVTGN